MANELESLRKVKYHNKMNLRRESRPSYSSMNRFTMLTFLINPTFWHFMKETSRIWRLFALVVTEYVIDKRHAHDQVIRSQWIIA